MLRDCAELGCAGYTVIRTSVRGATATIPVNYRYLADLLADKQTTMHIPPAEVTVTSPDDVLQTVQLQHGNLDRRMDFVPRVPSQAQDIRSYHGRGALHTGVGTAICHPSREE